MLAPGDIVLIALTALGCTAAVTALALLALRLGKNRPLGYRTVVVVLAAILSVVASTAAIAAEMYLSAHDFQVLLWVIGIAAAMSLVAAAVTARAARASLASLKESVKDHERGAVVAPVEGAGREIGRLSAQLSETSHRLAEARAELERLDAARRRFFAWISHDLRTPLTGISALSEALESGTASDPAGYLRQIRAQVGTMSRLVDDLFELSQIESGTLKLRLEDIELLDVVSDAVADVSPLAEARGIRITHAGVEGRQLRADPHELTRVLINLLSNSIRHAPAGSTITITAEHRGERLTLSVLDEGSGVSARDLEHIFEIGWRASQARTPGPETGAGLGLAIVQGIVEAHGGEVGAENVERGFRLSIALPA